MSCGYTLIQDIALSCGCGFTKTVKPDNRHGPVMIDSAHPKLNAHSKLAKVCVGNITPRAVLVSVTPCCYTHTLKSLFGELLHDHCPILRCCSCFICPQQSVKGIVSTGRVGTIRPSFRKVPEFVDKCHGPWRDRCQREITQH